MKLRSITSSSRRCCSSPERYSIFYLYVQVGAEDDEEVAAVRSFPRIIKGNCSLKWSLNDLPNISLSASCASALPAIAFRTTITFITNVVPSPALFSDHINNQLTWIEIKHKSSSAINSLALGPNLIILTKLWPAKTVPRRLWISSRCAC